MTDQAATPAELDYLDWLYGKLGDRPTTPDDSHYLSLGAGVQSSTLALMAARGEIGPMLAGAIFADTQAEPKAVYEWLDYLETMLPFPVHRVTAGSLTVAALKARVSAKGATYYKTSIPFHTLSETGQAGRITHRSCTVDHKIKPITKALRKLAKVKRGTKAPVVTSWIGISLDEMTRMKAAREPWIATRWPLIERRMTRRSCLEWLRSNGLPEPPRSACVYCPFKSNAEWRHLKTTDPDGFAAAVAFDHESRAVRAGTTLKSTAYVHRALVPLDQVDLRNDEDKGQTSLWDDECHGMCNT